MSYLHREHDEDEHDEDYEAPSQREVTLGTGTILSIFLGLALICGVFFAFGYNMGAKARQAAAVDAANPDSVANNAAFDHFSKPSPGAPAIQPVPGYMSSKDAAAANRAAANTGYNTPSSATGNAVNPVVVTRAVPTSSAPASVNTEREPVSAVAPVRSAPAAAGGTGSYVVQVAAVSHQEDADLLLNALKRKGYTVNAHHEADNLTHIQIGPFETKKDAEAMRQRLLTDGYNAIVK